MSICSNVSPTDNYFRYFSENQEFEKYARIYVHTEDISTLTVGFTIKSMVFGYSLERTEAVYAISMERRLDAVSKIKTKFEEDKSSNEKLATKGGLISYAASWMPFDRSLQSLQISAVKKGFEEE